MQRDRSGNFAAGTITATINGHATSATTAAAATSAANAYTVDGKSASELVRFAQAIGTNGEFTPFDVGAAAVFPNYADLPDATVQLTVPGAGVVLVLSAVAVNPDYAGTFDHVMYARLRDATPNAPFGAVSPYLQFREEHVDAVANYGYGALSPVYVFPVTGDGVKRFALQVSASVSTGDNRAYNAVVTALYVTFGPAGDSSLGTP